MMGRAGAGGLGWRVEQGVCSWDLVLCGSLWGDMVPHNKPGELCFATRKVKS